MHSEAEVVDFPQVEPIRNMPAIDVTSPNQIGAICDLAGGNAFFPGGNTPPVPVLAAFGSDRLHQCRAEGSWDFDRAIADDPHRLIRSWRAFRLKEATGEWEDLIFQFGPRTFLCGDQRRIVAYAATHSEAEGLVIDFTKRFGTPEPSSGMFHLIKLTSGTIGTEPVTLPEDTILSEETFDLHYPCGALGWHRDFASQLRTGSHGLSIFEGAPGTGKTSYLRHLAGCLRESHRFYFIPPCSMYVLKKPDFIDFWASQRRMHSHRKLIVILEDADASLMTRGSDNRDEVSAILNLSDGMLADFLRLHIICSINCKVAEIDQALLRPGRLLCHRVFGSLDYASATRLAVRLGRKLEAERDYTLAEVFARPASHEKIGSPRIGFGL